MGSFQNSEIDGSSSLVIPTCQMRPCLTTPKVLHILPWNIERTSDSTTSPARGPLRRVVERSCPVFKHHHVRLDFTCALPLHSSETEVLMMARYLLNFKGGYCVARGKNYKLYGTWYKVITSIVMSQLKVQYCCGLLKVLESCFLLLKKATTLWQLAIDEKHRV